MSLVPALRNFRTLGTILCNIAARLAVVQHLLPAMAYCAEHYLFGLLMATIFEVSVHRRVDHIVNPICSSILLGSIGLGYWYQRHTTARTMIKLQEKCEQLRQKLLNDLRRQYEKGKNLQVLASRKKAWVEEELTKAREEQNTRAIAALQELVNNYNILEGDNDVMLKGRKKTLDVLETLDLSNADDKTLDVLHKVEEKINKTTTWYKGRIATVMREIKYLIVSVRLISITRDLPLLIG